MTSDSVRDAASSGLGARPPPSSALEHVLNRDETDAASDASTTTA